MSKTSKGSVIAAALSLCVINPATASLMTLDIKWSGSPYGNNASATGFVTFNNSSLPEVGRETLVPLDVFGGIPSFFGPGFGTVSGLGITITGSRGGNGTFGMTDFRDIVFATPSSLDLGKELIGQPLTNGCIFGTSIGACGNGAGGDFNLFRSFLFAPFGPLPVAPDGTWYFQLTTAGGDKMLVTSIAPARSVPEPASLALLGIGLAGLGAIRHKRTYTRRP